MRYSELVITAFATYTKTVDLVSVTGLARSTIVKYKKDKELQRLADERRLQVVRESVYKMQAELTKCVDTLIKIRDNEENNPQIRVYACNCIMNHCRDWTLSVDVMKQIEELKTARESD